MDKEAGRISHVMKEVWRIYVYSQRFWHTLSVWETGKHWNVIALLALYLSSSPALSHISSTTGPVIIISQDFSFRSANPPGSTWSCAFFPCSSIRCIWSKNEKLRSPVSVLLWLAAYWPVHLQSPCCFIRIPGFSEKVFRHLISEFLLSALCSHFILFIVWAYLVGLKAIRSFCG